MIEQKRDSCDGIPACTLRLEGDLPLFHCAGDAGERQWVHQTGTQQTRSMAHARLVLRAIRGTWCRFRPRRVAHLVTMPRR